jgi:hypothetical protein
MRDRGLCTTFSIAPKSTATFVIEPPEEIIPAKVHVDAFEAEPVGGEESPMHAKAWKAKAGSPLDLVVIDIKVGKNSQTAGVGSFSTRLLPSMNMRLERCRKGIYVCATLYNPHNKVALTTFAVRSGGMPGAPGRFPLPFSQVVCERHQPGLVLADLALRDEEIGPSESGKFFAWSQLGGEVSELIVSSNFSPRCVASVSTMKGPTSRGGAFGDPVVCDIVFDGDKIILSGANKILPGDKVVVEVGNTGDRVLTSNDIVAMIVVPFSGGLSS